MTDEEKDFDIEKTEEFATEGRLEDKLKELREKLKLCAKEKAENLAGWQRSKADFINASRRAEDEKALTKSLALEELVRDFIPVLDSLDTALAGKPSDSASWRRGFENVHTLALKILEVYGLETIDAIGMPEDPRFHESIQTTPATDACPVHTVTTVLQKGYKIGEKVIRAAKVVVAV